MKLGSPISYLQTGLHSVSVACGHGRCRVIYNSPLGLYKGLLVPLCPRLPPVPSRAKAEGFPLSGIPEVPGFERPLSCRNSIFCVTSNFYSAVLLMSLTSDSVDGRFYNFNSPLGPPLSNSVSPLCGYSLGIFKPIA